MFTPQQLEKIPLEFEQIFKELEQSIYADIVRRLTINSEITRSADWQMNRLYELGASQTEIKAHIQKALELTNTQMDELYSKIMQEGYYSAKGLYEATGLKMVAFEDNQGLQQLIKAIQTQTSEQVQNMTKTLGFAINTPNGIEFTPIADYYQKTLDSAVMNISSGAFSYNQVLKNTVTELTKSGLRTVDYASGHSNRTTVAVRRAVMTGINQIASKVNSDNMEKLDTELVEVSYHGGARPSHQEWQGKVYRWDKGGDNPTKSKSKYKDLIEVTGYGTGEGLCGWNCYHDFSPFVDGISERQYTDEWLEEQNAKENIKQEFRGKEYTQYEALQRQRNLESIMRTQREKISLLEKGGADEDDIILARARYRTTSAEYTSFSDAMKLKQQRERVSIDGLKNIGVGEYKIKDKTLTSGGNSGIIENIQYNNYKMSISTGELSSLCNFDNYKVIEKEINDKLIGVTTSDGIIIKSKSIHFIARVIGSVEQKRNGVSVNDCISILLNPDDIKSTDVGNLSSVKYIKLSVGEVSVNPTTGNLIQVNPKGR